MQWCRPCLSIFAITLSAGTVATAADDETAANRVVKEVLPPEPAARPGYAVADPVVADGYMYTFNVASPYVKGPVR